MTDTNIMGETFEQWFAELCADYKVARHEDYGDAGQRGRTLEQLREFWQLGWDYEYILSYEAWVDYDPVD